MPARKYKLLISVLICASSLGCATIQDALKLRKPTASLQAVKFGEIKLKSALLLFDVQVENPYSVALPLVNVDYNLTTQADPFLAGSADLQSTIPAHGQETVTLPVQLNYLSFLQAVKQLKPGSTIPYSADVGLSVDAPALGLIRLPIKKQGKLSIPEIPDLSNIDFKKLLQKIK